MLIRFGCCFEKPGNKIKQTHTRGGGGGGLWSCHADGFWGCVIFFFFFYVQFCFMSGEPSISATSAFCGNDGDLREDSQLDPICKMKAKTKTKRPWIRLIRDARSVKKNLLQLCQRKLRPLNPLITPRTHTWHALIYWPSYFIWRRNKCISKQMKPQVKLMTLLMFRMKQTNKHTN